MLVKHNLNSTAIHLKTSTFFGHLYHFPVSTDKYFIPFGEVTPGCFKQYSRIMFKVLLCCWFSIKEIPSVDLSDILNQIHSQHFSPWFIQIPCVNMFTFSSGNCLSSVFRPFTLNNRKANYAYCPCWFKNYNHTCEIWCIAEWNDVLSCCLVWKLHVLFVQIRLNHEQL